MDFVIEQRVFQKALARCSAVVEKRNTIPILANLLLEAEASIVRVTSTDLDTTLIEEMAAEVKTPGKTTVAATMLHEIVRRFPGGAQVHVLLDAQGEGLEVSSGRARFRLATLSADDFPAAPTENLSHRFVLPAQQLAQLLESTSFAVSHDESRYYLSGVYLHVDPLAPAEGSESQTPPQLCAVATDGHRLARCVLPAPSGSQGMPSIIVPRKTVAELRRLAEEDSAAEIALEVCETLICCTQGRSRLLSRLIDGNFPDYHRVIPSGNDKICTLDPQVFLQAIERVAVMATDRSKAVRLGFSAGCVTLSASDGGGGTANEEIEASYDHASLELGFNSRYLLEIVRQIDDKTMRLALLDENAPALISAQAEGAAFYVLMPMRL